MPRRIDRATGLDAGPDRIACAASHLGCTSLAEPPPVPMLDGHPMPPEGWGVCEIIFDNGGVFVVFTCSKACERRIASNPPPLRGIGDPAPPPRPWRP